MAPGPVVEAAADVEIEQQVSSTEETQNKKPQPKVPFLVPFFFEWSFFSSFLFHSLIFEFDLVFQEDDAPVVEDVKDDDKDEDDDDEDDDDDDDDDKEDGAQGRLLSLFPLFPTWQCSRFCYFPYKFWA